jgi:hypothetical protein
LVEQGIKEVVPPPDILLKAYRLADAKRLLRRRLRQVWEAAQGVELLPDLPLSPGAAGRAATPALGPGCKKRAPERME